MTFPYYNQHDAKDCGPACLRMIAKHYGKNYSLQRLRELSYITRDGVSLLGISDAAENIGFRTLPVCIDFDKFIEEAPLPCIIHWRQNHFVVVYEIKGLRKQQLNEGVSKYDLSQSGNFFVADPSHGLVKYSTKEFLGGWISTNNNGQNKGIALLIQPTVSFYEQEDEKSERTGIKFLFNYLRPHKKFAIQLIVGMVFGSLLQLIFPFLTQSIVDKGIGYHNLNFVYLVLIAQFVLITSRTSVDFIRNWLLLHISTRINISLISDFLIKLMKLPIGFFDTKMTGDILQRIGDHTRIEQFLTSSSLTILFSMVNLVIFSIVLATYNIAILGVFLAGSTIYFLWLWLFMKKRRELDFKRFSKAAENQSTVIQLIAGMQEIKQNNCEKQQRWKWERIQAKLFNVSLKSMALSQYQQIGGVFFNESKNILITFLAAYSVIKGDMTLGMMMSVQYIIGQLNSPIDQMINFMRAAQDAKISMERLSEIHMKDDESDGTASMITILNEDKAINVRNLNFQYEGPHSEKVLKNINLKIPEGNITAIVGSSGSGKTTLMKMLLGFYSPITGEINIGDINLKHINPQLWRQHCGVVLQDGFIFSESIAANIAVGEESIDREKLIYAVNAANIKEFIESLPLAYNTKIGQEGSGISQGQRQRILIARAVYKNPQYLFFDEATNALDTNNEKIIMDNLRRFFTGRTVIIIAHRLSTVRDAQQIVMLSKGSIIEMGPHEELISAKGAYYNLVKNQLELGC